jgi:hypothetical protein
MLGVLLGFGIVWFNRSMLFWKNSVSIFRAEVTRLGSKGAYIGSEEQRLREGLVTSALNMETAFSATLALTYKTTWCQNSTQHQRYNNSNENLKSTPSEAWCVIR